MRPGVYYEPNSLIMVELTADRNLILADSLPYWLRGISFGAWFSVVQKNFKYLGEV